MVTRAAAAARAASPFISRPRRSTCCARSASAGRACSPRPKLQRLLWPDTHVSDANLPNLVTEVRAALADDARSPRFVRTSARGGLRVLRRGGPAGPGRPSEYPLVYRLNGPAA